MEKPTLKFLGGTGEVTGSMHLLEVSGKKILIDCGFFQGRREESYKRNKNFPFDPKTIDALIVSHAHIDHTGNIPNLVKQGFTGNIYATIATRDLCSVMLKDSAHIQLQDSEYINKRKHLEVMKAVQPIYDIEDVEKAMTYFIGLSYERSINVCDNVKLTFYNSGHVLGSAFPVLDINDNGKTIRFGYLVDMGRKGLPILSDPVVLKDLDIAVMESTYGNKEHDNIADAEKELRDVINRTYQRKGKVVIPSFSLERTQEMIYFIKKMLAKKEIPEMPVYVDSPLAINITEVFRLHSEYFDKEIQDMLVVGDDPFNFEGLHYVRKVGDSQAIQLDAKPMIIISASGMCEVGRILHHLKNNVEDPRSTILVVSFMAENTLGRRIVERQKQLKIFGKEYTLKAEVATINSFSAHADQTELLSYARASEKNTQFYLVHGEALQSQALLEKMQSQGNKKVSIPKPGDKIQVTG